MAGTKLRQRSGDSARPLAWAVDKGPATATSRLRDAPAYGDAHLLAVLLGHANERTTDRGHRATPAHEPAYHLQQYANRSPSRSEGAFGRGCLASCGDVELNPGPLTLLAPSAGTRSGGGGSPPPDATTTAASSTNLLLLDGGTVDGEPHQQLPEQQRRQPPRRACRSSGSPNHRPCDVPQLAYIAAGPVPTIFALTTKEALPVESTSFSFAVKQPSLQKSSLTTTTSGGENLNIHGLYAASSTAVGVFCTRHHRRGTAPPHETTRGPSFQDQRTGPARTSPVRARSKSYSSYSSSISSHPQRGTTTRCRRKKERTAGGTAAAAPSPQRRHPPPQHRAAAAAKQSRLSAAAARAPQQRSQDRRGPFSSFCTSSCPPTFSSSTSAPPRRQARRRLVSITHDDTSSPPPSSPRLPLPLPPRPPVVVVVRVVPPHTPRHTTTTGEEEQERRSDHHHGGGRETPERRRGAEDPREGKQKEEKNKRTNKRLPRTETT